MYLHPKLDDLLKKTFKFQRLRFLTTQIFFDVRNLKLISQHKFQNNNNYNVVLKNSFF